MKVVDFPNQNQMEASVTSMERDFDLYVRMIKLTARMKAETFKAFLDEGFTEEQAIDMIKASYQ